MLRASLGSTPAGIVRAGVGERRTVDAPTDNVVVTVGRVTGSRFTLTIRDLAAPEKDERAQRPSQAATQVVGPMMPDGLIPLRFWKATTAVLVAGP